MQDCNTDSLLYLLQSLCSIHFCGKNYNWKDVSGYVRTMAFSQVMKDLENIIFQQDGVSPYRKHDV